MATTKKSKHAQLVQAASEAIDAVFSDTSVGRESTRGSMHELREEIDGKLLCLDEDDRNNAKAGR